MSPSYHTTPLHTNSVKHRLLLLLRSFPRLLQHHITLLRFRGHRSYWRSKPRSHPHLYASHRPTRTSETQMGTLDGDSRHPRLHHLQHSKLFLQQHHAAYRHPRHTSRRQRKYRLLSSPHIRRPMVRQTQRSSFRYHRQWRWVWGSPPPSPHQRLTYQNGVPDYHAYLGCYTFRYGHPTSLLCETQTTAIGHGYEEAVLELEADPFPVFPPSSGCQSRSGCRLLSAGHLST